MHRAVPHRTAESIVETLNSALEVDGQVASASGVVLSRERTQTVQFMRQAAESLVAAFKTYAEYYQITFGSSGHWGPFKKQVESLLASAAKFASAAASRYVGEHKV